MIYSALYRVQAMPSVTINGPLGPFTYPANGYVNVTPRPLADGTIIVHAEPGAPSPDGSTPIWGGTTPCDWALFAAAQPATAAACMPNEFGESPSIVANVPKANAASANKTFPLAATGAGAPVLQTAI